MSYYSGKRPLMGVTIGDPKGVGPEVVEKAIASLSAQERHGIQVYGDLTLTAEKARRMSDIEAACIAVDALDAAIHDAQTGKIAAVVTAPVNKERMQLVAPNFTGHTGYIANACHVRDVSMFFVPLLQKGDQRHPLRMGLVTTHIPLHLVASSLTRENMVKTAEQIVLFLRDHLNIPQPRLAVLGLNPHAGENGKLGAEEKEVIEPAIAKIIQRGMICEGPFAADTFFATRAHQFDATIAMYHDQALIPMKTLFPHEAVNITLGLPFIRTSPAHGTAETIAWQGKADARGMLAAIRLTDYLLGEGGRGVIQSVDPK